MKQSGPSLIPKTKTPAKRKPKPKNTTKDNPNQDQLKIKGDTQIPEEILTKDPPLIRQMNEVAKEVVNHGPRITHEAWKEPTKELLDSCEQRKGQIIKEQLAKFVILKDIPEKLTQEEERYNQLQEDQERHQQCRATTTHQRDQDREKVWNKRDKSSARAGRENPSDA